MPDTRSFIDLVTTDSFITQSGNTLTEKLETTFKLDDDDYDGTVTFTLEGSLKDNSGARTAEVVLREKGQTTDLVTLTVTGVSLTRKDGTFTYPASPQAAKEFTLWLRSQDGSGQCTLSGARIIIDQVGASKRTYAIPIGIEDTETSTSYTKPADRRRILWEAEKAKFDGTVQAYLEVVGKISSGTGDVALSLTSGTSEVTDTKVTVNNTSITRFRAATDCWDNLSEASIYETIRRKNTSGTLTIHRVSLIIVQTGSFTKGLSYTSLIFDQLFGGVATIADRRHKLDKTKYSGTLAIYWEGTLKDVTPDGVDALELFDVGTSDTSTTGSADGSLPADSSSMTLETTSDLESTLTTGNRYVVRGAGVSGGLHSGTAWLKFEHEDEAVAVFKPKSIIY